MSVSLCICILVYFCATAHESDRQSFMSILCAFVIYLSICTFVYVCATALESDRQSVIFLSLPVHGSLSNYLACQPFHPCLPRKLYPSTATARVKPRPRLTCVWSCPSPNSWLLAWLTATQIEFKSRKHWTSQRQRETQGNNAGLTHQ